MLKKKRKEKKKKYIYAIELLLAITKYLFMSIDSYVKIKIASHF